MWLRRIGELYVDGMTPMGMLFIVAFLAGSIWALGALVRRLRRKHAGVRWWAGFFMLSLLGISGGIWCASLEYPLGQHFRIGSFPIPVVFFHLEDGQWVDFPVPEFQAWSAVLTNIITITALATVPLWLLSWRQHRDEKTQPATSANPG